MEKQGGQLPEQEGGMDGIGRLNVKVYTSLAQIPVSGATVVVTGKGEQGKRKLLSVQTTDRSGNVKPITVNTPAAQESTSPGNGETPYTVCDVWAEHPGFAILLVEGVQVFSGVDTFQGMELNPLSEGKSSLNTTDVREIPSQNL